MKKLFLFTCILAAAFTGRAQFYNNSYEFNQLDFNADLPVLKASELVINGNLMTVSHATEPGTGLHDIILTSTDRFSGRVLWARSYGLQGIDELGHGLIVSHDNQHVIIVGSAEDPQLQTQLNGLAMKVNIATGNVVWAQQFEKDACFQDLRLIDRTFTPQAGGGTLLTYFVVGTSWDAGNPDERHLFAASILDVNGTQLFGNNYLDLAPMGESDVPSAMQLDLDGNYQIAGTRTENTTDANIFLIGINPITGAISDNYQAYEMPGASNHFDPSIADVAVSGFAGFGLAFTTHDPGIGSGVDDAITVLTLDTNRSIVAGNFYWRPNHTINRPLAIYQSTVNAKNFDIFTHTLEQFNKGGMLNAHLMGGVSDHIIFNAFNPNDDMLPRSMVRTIDGYVAKSLLETTEGLWLTGTNPVGKTTCADQVPTQNQVANFIILDIPYGLQPAGNPRPRVMPLQTLNGAVTTCDQTLSASFKQTTPEVLAEETENRFSIAPNPVSAQQAVVRLRYDVAAAQSVTIGIHNALGQLVYLERAQLLEGQSQLTLDASNFASGLNLVSISSERGMLHQSKVLKE